MKNPKIIYVFDTLCSWCYAFHRPLNEILNKYPDYDFEIISGGMYIGEHRRNALDIISPDRVKEMYQHVQEYGKAEISEAYLQDLLINKNYYVDSERPARGICAFKNFESNPRLHFQFSYDLQKNIFVKGIDPNSKEFFSSVLPKYKIDEKAFFERYENEISEDEAKAEFKLARDFGINSYPQLLLQVSEREIFLIAKGYTPAENIENVLEEIKREGQENDELQSKN